jgi:ABC-type sugar transport system permease subunit
VLVFLLITSTIAIMTMFTQPYVLTDGGPRNNTLTPLLYIYRLGFGGRIGDAAALSFLLSVLMLAITFTQFFLTRSREES